MKRETPRLYVRIKNKKQNKQKKPTKPSVTVLTHSQSLSLG